MSKSNLLVAIEEVLFREWDPIGVNDNELCRDEYDNYAKSLLRLLSDGADEFKIASRLCFLQRSSMALSVVDEERNRQVAKRLRKLVDSTTELVLPLPTPP